eukprot:gene4278-778_t
MARQTEPTPVNKYAITLVNHTASEGYAANFLSSSLKTACGVQIPVLTPDQAKGHQILAVGAAATLSLEPGAALSDLGDEGYVIISKLDSYGLSGAPFLRSVGFTFNAPGDTVAPSLAAQPLPKVDTARFLPSLEYRDCNNVQENDPVWSVASEDNLFSPSKAGGGIQYVNVHPGSVPPFHAATILLRLAALPLCWYASPPGFVHTSNHLVPPANYSASHPEWFGEGAHQLCWANESLVQFVITRVRGYLHASPQANIISVSQNDNTDYCKRPADQAIIDEEGSPMGPLLRAVNTIADAIKAPLLSSENELY